MKQTYIKPTAVVFSLHGYELMLSSSITQTAGAEALEKGDDWGSSSPEESFEAGSRRMFWDED